MPPWTATSRVSAKPYLATLSEPLAEAGTLLYRRGNFNGTFDQLICDAQRAVGDAQIALSPGFRWGTTVLPGQTITMEHVLDQTCITYPETYVREMSGEQIKLILEDVCDNLFNPDPYYQQGGDMVRVGGMDYVCDPKGGRGQSHILDDARRRHCHRSRANVQGRRLGHRGLAGARAAHLGRGGGVPARCRRRRSDPFEHAGPARRKRKSRHCRLPR